MSDRANVLVEGSRAFYRASSSGQPIEISPGVFIVPELFWRKTAEGQSGCLEWVGPRNHFRDGYGYVVSRGSHQRRKNLRAHRVAWALVNGPIPDGQFVLHRCDNPPCVNPDHLYLGTQLDNMRDMHRKGRGSVGPRNNFWRKTNIRGAKLSARQLRALRKDLRRGLTHQAIANRYGVSRSLVGMIANGKVWTSKTEKLL